MRHLRPSLATAALTVGALVVTGCGGNAALSSQASPTPTVAATSTAGGALPTATDSSAAPSTGAPAPSKSSIVPAVDVIDVNTGRSVALRATIATDKPTLLWMWAPH